MGLKSEVSSILNQSLHVAVRPPTVAAMGIAAHNIFTLSGGPAFVRGFFMYANVAMGAASSWQLTICGVIAENGGAAVANLLVGEMAIWPLHGAAAADVTVPNVANAPYPPIATQILGLNNGILISPGSAAGDIFVMTVGAVICPAATVSFYVLYHKMLPQTLIAPIPG